MISHKKLIFINSSASFAYVEVPLSRHVLIKATGNVGKSSILNAFKLFWLPEINFSGCERKFKFVSRQADSGYYSGDDAFAHYFPTNRSFLILECENLHGYFCQILYPRANRGYGRIMVRSSYSDIEHLFWNKKEGVDGLGSPNPDLSVTNITAYLKANGFEFENVTTKERLFSLLYSDSVIDQDSQYSIFPLKNQSQQYIKTFTSLVHAMCGAKSDNEELVGMFASIIEGQKVDHNDILSLDLEKIMIERDELDKEAHQLSILEQNRHEAENAIRSYDVASNLISVGADFLAVESCLDKERRILATDKDKLLAQQGVQRQAYKNLKELIDKKRTDNSTLKGSINTLEKEHKTLLRKIESGEEILKEFRLSPINGMEQLDFNAEGGVYDLIRDDTKALEDELSVLEDKEKKARLISSLESKKRDAEEKLAISNTKLSNFNALLINSVSSHARNTLLSLDSNFGAIPVGLFADYEISVIENFCSLFVGCGRKATLNNVPFGEIKPTASVVEIEESIVQLKEEIVDIDCQLSSLNNSDLNFKLSAINTLKDKIAKNKRDINTLGSYLPAFNDEPEKRSELEKLRVAKEKCEQDLQQLNESLNKCLDNGKKIGDDLKGIDASISNINSKKDRLDQCRLTPCFNDLICDVKVSSKIELKNSLSTEVIDELSRGFRNFQASFNSAKSSLSCLVANGVLNDDLRIVHQSSATLSSLTSLIRDTKSIFEQIEPRRKVLSDNVSAHKSIISMKMQELRGNARAISSYRSRINRMFESFKINNLSGVQVDLILDPRFQNLLEQADKTDLESDTEINTAFYERLDAFISSFFKDGNKELTVDKIIKSVIFKTKKADGQWLVTGQSNSSVSLIVIPLIQSLMRDMLNTDIGFLIPMQVDEVAHIDPSQIRWLIDMLADNGFTLLGASTHNINAQTLIAINAEINLGDLRVDKAYSSERDLVLFGGIEGEVLA